jgi:hypothetical protein
MASSGRTFSLSAKGAPGQRSLTVRPKIESRWIDAFVMR